MTRWAFYVVASFAIVAACTPEQRAAAPAAVDGACVLLHAFARSPEAEAVCATAEDLAPFVGAILASRSSDASARKISRPVVLHQVAELPRPSSSVASRRCVAWETDDGR